MANAFTTEDRTAFKDIMKGFEDALTISRNVSVYNTEGQSMERQSDIINRPVPYILTSQDRTLGTPVTAQDANELKVPCVLDQQKNVNWTMDAKEMRDQIRDGRLGKSAYHRLASDINTKVRDVASLEGTLVVANSGAASTYDQVALAESLMLEQGVDSPNRCLALTARDYNGMAGNLSVASRSFGNEKSDSAYEKSYLGMVAGFETLKIDGGKVIGANSATVTIDTTGSLVEYAPAANTDNRTQSVTVSTTTGVAVGDCFTIAGIEAVHHITKDSTTELKTFRVTEVTDGTTLKISPPIIGAGGGTDSELQYKNVEVASTSATAAITFLNIAQAGANPFWCKEAIELMPGRYSVPGDQGVDVLRGTTDNGIEVVMGKSFSNKTFVTEYTLDVFYGVTMLNPEMAGIVLFGQV